MSVNLLAMNKVPLGDQPIQGAGTIGEAVSDNLGTNTGGVAGGGVIDVFTQQFSNIIGFITVLAGVFFVVYFMVAAFEWLQAGGDSGKVEKAKNRMINAALGLLVMVIAFGIIGIIGGVFGIELLNPGATFLEMIRATNNGAGGN